MSLSINKHKIITGMLLIILLLLIAHTIQASLYFYIGDEQVFDWIHLLDFDYEGNLPTIYSALALFFCAMLLMLISTFEFRQQAVNRFHWLGLVIIFCFLALDVSMALHEELGDFIGSQIKAEGYLYFPWVLPYSLLLTVFLIFYLRFLWRLPRSIAKQLVLAGGLFISGALGLEIFSAREADLNGTDTITYAVFYTLEELLEMVAIVIFAHCLLGYLQKHVHAVELRFS